MKIISDVIPDISRAFPASYRAVATEISYRQDGTPYRATVRLWGSVHPSKAKAQEEAHNLAKQLRERVAQGPIPALI